MNPGALPFVPKAAGSVGGGGNSGPQQPTPNTSSGASSAPPQLSPPSQMPQLGGPHVQQPMGGVVVQGSPVGMGPRFTGQPAPSYRTHPAQHGPGVGMPPGGVAMGGHTTHHHHHFVQPPFVSHPSQPFVPHHQHHQHQQHPGSMPSLHSQPPFHHQPHHTHLIPPMFQPGPSMMRQGGQLATTGVKIVPQPTPVVHMQPRQVKPKVILLIGPPHVGIEEHAKKLQQENKQLQVVCGNTEEDPEAISLSRLGAYLVEYAKKSRPKAFVLHGYLQMTHLESYLLATALSQASLSLDSVIFFEPSSEYLKQLDWEPEARMALGATWEACTRYFCEGLMKNSFIRFEVNGEFEEDYNTMLRDEILPLIQKDEELPPADLPPMALFPGVTLVKDPVLIESASAAILEVLGTSDLTDLISTPARSIAYNTFVRFHNQLQHYHVQLCIDGERGLLVKYKDNLMVFMQLTGIVYFLEAVLLGEQCPALQKAEESTSSIEFVLDVVVTSALGKVFILDYLFLNGSAGRKQMFLVRQQHLKDWVAVQNSAALELAPTQPLRQVSALVATGVPSLGIHLIHPGGYTQGFALRNFVMYTQAVAAFRLWNSDMRDIMESRTLKTKMWVFDGFLIGDDGTEQKYSGSDREIVIADMALAEDIKLYDGHLVLCEKVEKGKNMYFKVKRKLDHLRFPSAEFFVRRMIEPEWSAEDLVAAFKELPYRPLLEDPGAQLVHQEEEGN